MGVCKDCIHVEMSFDHHGFPEPRSFCCKLHEQEQLELDFIGGHKTWTAKSLCSKHNADGSCEDFLPKKADPEKKKRWFRRW